MDKSTFEKLLNERADRIYFDAIKVLEAEANEVAKYFDGKYNFMNAHDSGQSTKVEIIDIINRHLKSKSQAILKKIITQETDRILTSLESVKFLFQQED